MIAAVVVLFLFMAVVGTISTVDYLAWRSVQRDRAEAKRKADES